METTEKFTGKSEIYAKYRPGYPAACIDYLLEAVGIEKGGTVADIGAGTGILTGQLLARGLRVYAVEPNGDMRAAAERAFGGKPGFIPVAAPAEDTGLEGGCTGLVTAAQAFHWFDREKFKKECARILKPGAGVALMWNSRDPASGLVQENAEICRRFCPAFNGFSGDPQQDPSVFRAFFRDGKYECRTFRNDIMFDLDGFIGRNLSASYAPAAADAGCEPFVEALTQLFGKYADGGRMLMPNMTRSYFGGV